MPFFRLAMILLLFMLLPLSTLAGDRVEQDYQKAREEYRKLLAAPEKQKFRDNWIRVIDRLAAVASGHPDRPQAAAGLYLAGKAGQGLFGIFARTEDARQALGRLDELVQKYPDHSLADDALMLGAALLENALKEPSEAWLRYRRAAEAKGDMASEAMRNATRLARFAPQESPPAIHLSKEESPIDVNPKAGNEGTKGQSQLTGIRFWSNPGYTRVVLDLSGPAEFTANFLRGDPGSKLPPRLYIDLAGTVAAGGISETTTVNDGLLKQIRAGRHTLETMRIVLDLVSIKDYKVFPLEDPRRIVLDIQGEREQLAADIPEMRAPSAGTGDAVGKLLTRLPDEKPLKIEVPPASATTLRRVVVDAGHGGKDPGAIGPSGIREKDVTLSMARILARRLRKEIGCDVILTRDSDVFIPLEERTAIANRVGADLFISIHANAATNKEAFGIETYYLNFSKNDKAAAVAARENGTSLKQVGDLELILFDLMANSKINESSRLAAEIQRALVSDLGRHYSHVRDLGVRQGPFYVLLGATMPSVLVETAFISHPREESRLVEALYHEKSAEAIVRAVRSFAEAQRMIATR